MKKNYHLSDFLILIIILTTNLGAIYYFRSFSAAKSFFSLFLALTYILWGILHHYRDRDLSMKIILEYAGFGFLIALLLITF